MKINQRVIKKTEKTNIKNVKTEKTKGLEKVNFIQNNKIPKIFYLIVFFAAFLAYVNTFNHKYVLDDYSVIKGNFVTQKGLEGIPIIFKTGYRYGFWNSPDDLYRPFVLSFFAILWEISEDNPTFYHIVNVLIYSFLCVIIFIFLNKILPNYNKITLLLISLIFALHPIHTEVVANIKSLDEIFSLLFSIISLLIFLKLLENYKTNLVILLIFAYLVAMLSKESSIVFLLIIPLTAYFFTKNKISKIILNTLWLIIPILIFFVLREKAIGKYLHLHQTTMLDNVLVSAKDIFIRYASAIRILGMYFLKLLIPWPLACDYSYNQIPLVSFSNFEAILSFIFHTSIFLFAILKFKEKNIFSYLILFYLISMSISSNLFYLIGTAFAERLLFIASLPFSMFIGILISRITRSEQKEFDIKPILLGSIILIIYFSLTFYRNKEWETSLSLYSSDVKKNWKSAHMNYFYALELMNALAMKDGLVFRPEYLDSSIKYFRKAIKIYPVYADAYEQMGLAYYRRNDWDSALICFDSALVFYPTKYSAYGYIGAIYFNRKQLDKALEAFEKSVKYNPKFADGWFNLGSTYGELGRYEEAIKAFKKCIEYSPKKAEAYKFIGITYKKIGDNQLAEEYLNKAYQLKPSLKE